MRKKNLYKRGKSTSSICNEVEEKGIFDKVGYEGPKGQEGVFVEIWRGELEATLRREGTPSAQGYNGTLENPTRITYLNIRRHGNTEKHYGIYDPKELMHSPRHRFEKDAEKNPGLKKFLEDILKYFNEL
jgi:hypothetical protein